MPVYMDRHYVEGATRHAIAHAHERDLATQAKYGVHFMTYWFDEQRCASSPAHAAGAANGMADS